MWSLPKTALYISPKKEEWSCCIIGGTLDGKKPFSILSSPKQFDSTYLRAQNRKMKKLLRKCCHQIWYYFSHPACFVYWNWTDINQQTDVSFIWKTVKVTKEEFPSQSRQLFWNSGSEEWKGYFFFSFLLVQTDEATLSSFSFKVVNRWTFIL